MRQIIMPASAVLLACAGTPAAESSAPIDADASSEVSEPEEPEEPEAPGELYGTGGMPLGQPGMLTPPDGSTDLSPESIRQVVKAHVHEVRACYQAGLERDPGLTGRLSVAFEIGPSGAVDAVEMVGAEEFPDPEVPACIARAIASWQFPAPPDGGRIRVSYPWTFVPDDR